MMKEADEGQFIVCAPDGWENSHGERAWNDCREDDPFSPGTNDVFFIEELLRWFPESGYDVEGYGVDPDYEVENAPHEMAAGRDPQLETAIAVIVRQLEKEPPARPQKPPYPDRSGIAK